MGCVNSRKKECAVESHPQLYDVSNLDEEGTVLWSGQMGLTETNLILYRMGREDTVWPISSLRRYGFDLDTFSFESGRRCLTGEGIYAFRCEKASTLFHQLQHIIQLKNILHENMQFSLPPNMMGGSPRANPRVTLQASVIHRSSIDNGQARNILHNPIPGHLSNATDSINDEQILENTPLYPRPHSHSTQVTNLYQVKEFKPREHNNNQSEQATNMGHTYTNDIELMKTLAKLRIELKESVARGNNKDFIEETAFLQALAANDSTPASPTVSTVSDHEHVRFYQNLRATDVAKQEFLKNFEHPSTPFTPKQPEYCNLNINNRPEISYANVNVGQMEEGLRSMKNNIFVSTTHKLSESDTNASMSPSDEVNYAILELEAKDSSKVARDVMSPESRSMSSSRHESTTSQCSVPQPGGARHLSTSSVDNAPFSISAAPGSIGYTTIDFDKTVALTAVVTGNEMMDVDGTRKTRHDSNCGTPVKAK